MKNLLLYLLLLTAPNLHAQFVEQKSFYIPHKKVNSSVDTLFSIQSDRWVSSVVVRIRSEQDFYGAEINSNKQKFDLSIDEHVGVSAWKTSNLILFDHPVKDIKLIPSSIKNSLQIFLINPDNQGAIRLESNNYGNLKIEAMNPSMPEMIDQSYWRAGLPPPNYDRIWHKVNNNIIHHSATSNRVTNFTSAVRNIYIYHTEVNRWSDIGYNYLIAPNGDIYKGRDPGSYEQDEVLGAHFCSRNTGTMGVCLLGTYTETAPSEPSMHSLALLLAWKSAKDHLDPLGTFPHPLDSELPVIAGHQDGCSTLCPGDSVYSKLPVLRTYVNHLINISGIEWIGDLTFETTHKIYPNPFTDEILIENVSDIQLIKVIDGQGREVFKKQSPIGYLELGFLNPGYYFLRITSELGTETHRVVKR